jgi:hypothetical protein
MKPQGRGCPKNRGADIVDAVTEVRGPMLTGTVAFRSGAMGEVCEGG